jgi:hypothetical protein
VREYVGIARCLRKIAVDVNRIVVARSPAVHRQGVSCDRRIRPMEKLGPRFGSRWIWNGQPVNPLMSRRLSSDPFDNLPPLRLQGSRCRSRGAAIYQSSKTSLSAG